MTIMSVLINEGSLNKMITLSTIVSGAIVYDMEVRIFAMDEAVWAFRKDRYKNLKVESSIEGYENALLKGIEEGKISKWYEQLAELKEMGNLQIHCCAYCCILDNLEKKDFLDIVDNISNIGIYINKMILNSDKVITI